jgi:hypothetical protein
MKTITLRYSPTFVTIAQSIQYHSAVFAPLLSTFLAAYIGLTYVLLFSTAIRLLGFILFARQDHRAEKLIPLDVVQPSINSSTE